MNMQIESTVATDSSNILKLMVQSKKAFSPILNCIVMPKTKDTSKIAGIKEAFDKDLENLIKIYR